MRNVEHGLLRYDAYSSEKARRFESHIAPRVMLATCFVLGLPFDYKMEEICSSESLGFSKLKVLKSRRL
jgi:hypothetical protein